MYLVGKWCYDLAKRLFPICRSITGNGFRESLNILKEYLSEISVYEVPSGTKVFDWTVPKEWNINDAYIEDESGHRVLDFKESNLHVVGYSFPIDKWMDWVDLRKIVHTLPDQPDLIPYVTSYYKEYSGFCMTENQKRILDSTEGRFHAVIDSNLKEGFLTYGECVIHGDTDEEVLISTYLCHPSMANNECSGPCLALALAEMIKQWKKHRYTYRFLFLPETIGAITYLSEHYKEMKKNIVAGFVLSCVGDDRDFSFVETRYGNTLTDKVLEHVLRHKTNSFHKYSYMERASDERQYNSPGIDLPVCAFCRSKYGTYPEYHTSGDDLSLISEQGFQGAFEVMKSVLEILERNRMYKVRVLCEPQLGRRNLYPSLSEKANYYTNRQMVNFLAYADGTNDLIDIANRIVEYAGDLLGTVEILLESALIDTIN